MKYFILLSLVAIARALDCSEGELTWCSSIAAAKECGAVNYCKDTVWQNLQLSQDSSDICSFCEAIMQDVQKWMQEQKTEEEIKNFLDSACNILPETDLQQKCSQIVDNDLPILILLISEELEPSLICGLMGLCKNSDVFAEVTTAPSAQPLQKVEMTGDICADCKTFFGDIKDEVTSKTTEQQLEDLINNLFCNNLPAEIGDECKQLVDSYTPEILKMLADQMDPSQECQAMGFCQPLDEAAKVLIPRLRLLNSRFHQEAVGDQYCDICKEVITEAKSLESDPAVEQEIELALDEFICEKMGDLMDMCKTEIKQYLPEILKLISSKLDPEQDCQAIGLCTSRVEVGEVREEVEEVEEVVQEEVEPETYPFIALLDSKVTANDLQALRESGPKMTKVKDTEQCEICQLVMKYLDQTLEKNATQTEIIHALDKVCSVLPRQVAQQCEDFINTYAPVILILLSTEISPQEICSAIGLCKSQASSTAAKLTQAQKVGGSTPQCILCEFVMNQLDQLLEQNSTEAEIVKALDQVCSLLPKTISQECDDFVNLYGPAVLALLLQEVQPSEVCAFVGLCKSSQIRAPIKSGELCPVCETMISYVESLLGENATQEEIEQTLDKVCNFLPETFRDQCDQIIAQYEPMLIQLLLQELTPKEVCTELKLCDAAKKVAVPLKDIIVPQTQPLLGANECTWGPAYWCSSRENAAKCKAEAHCMKHVWN